MPCFRPHRVNVAKLKGQIEVLKVAKIKPRLLGLQATALYLDMAYRTLTNQRSLGTFPLQAVMRGGKPFYLVEELDQLIDEMPREIGV